MLVSNTLQVSAFADCFVQVSALTATSSHFSLPLAVNVATADIADDAFTNLVALALTVALDAIAALAFDIVTALDVMLDVADTVADAD